MNFYTKIGRRTYPVSWRHTPASLIHATADGRVPLCDTESTLLPARRSDGDLSNHPLTCNACAERVFRVCETTKGAEP